jgi:hypothetical protein
MAKPKLPDLSLLPDGAPFTAIEDFDDVANGSIVSRYLAGRTYRLTETNRGLVAGAVAAGQARLGGAAVEPRVRARGRMGTGGKSRRK